MDWAQTRVLQYVMERKVPEPPAAPSIADRADYFRSLGFYYAHLGLTPAELRLSIEPLHPFPEAEHDAQVAALLGDGEYGAHGLSLISRSLVHSYNPVAPELFTLSQAPTPDQDVVLFDNLLGFATWEKHNAWIGNVRDLVDLPQMPKPLFRLFIQQPSDYFSLGRSLFRRLVGPLLRKPIYVEPDESDIPTTVVESAADLEALADDLRGACERSGLPIAVVFRGQTREFLLPDRLKLAHAGITPFADVRDPSIVPSLYRRYDSFTNDLQDFRAFIRRLVDWSFHSDMVFGDPAMYLTLDGKPYTPKPVGDDAQAEMTLAFAGGSGSANRAFEDLGPYTTWTVKDPSGQVIDTYVKAHRPGHDSVRRNLILQHYGAPTPLVDVTLDIRVAEWFAVNEMSIDGDGLTTSGVVEGPFRNSAIYVFLVLDGMAPLVRTDALVTAEESLRPHRQACAVLGGAGNLYRNAVSRHVALKIKCSDSFVPQNLPTAQHLFPGPDEDDTLKKLLEMDREPAPFPVYRLH